MVFKGAFKGNLLLKQWFSCSSGQFKTLRVWGSLARLFRNAQVLCASLILLTSGGISMIKTRRSWPDNWRRGPRLGARVKTKRWGERAMIGAACVGVLYAVALQFTGGPTESLKAPSAAQVLAAAAPSVSKASAEAISPEEQKVWSEATLSRTRQKYEAYQQAFPNGLYASQAQQALSSCREQTRQRWQPNAELGAAQASRGEAALLEGMDQGKACANARNAARSHAEQSCASGATPSSTGITRSKLVVLSEDVCGCGPDAGGAVICVAQIQTACRPEALVTRIVETCGG